MAAPAMTFKDDGYKVFVAFIETFLGGVTFRGFQSGFGFRPGAPDVGSTSGSFLRSMTMTVAFRSCAPRSRPQTIQSTALNFSLDK
jgi:hypothetical protein